MGFNKKYINEEKIRTVLREDGIQALIDFIKKPDALIIEDDFSSQVCDIIKKTEKNKLLDELLKKTNLYGE